MSNMRAKRRQMGPSKRKGFDKSVCSDGIYANTRFTHTAASLVGLNVQVQVKNGGMYEGIFKTFSSTMEICLEQAHKLDKDQPSNLTSIPTQDRLIEKVMFNLKDIVLLEALCVDLDAVNKDAFVDTAISGKHNGQPIVEKELKPWDGEQGGPGDELMSIGNGSESSSNGWDAENMFKRNEEKYNVRTSYDPNLSQYTTALVKEDTKEYREREAIAARIAQEIESSETYRKSMALENGDGDEEMTHSAVHRPDDHSSPGATSGKYIPPQLRRHTQQGRPTPRSTPPTSSAPSQSPNPATTAKTPNQSTQPAPTKITSQSTDDKSTAPPSAQSPQHETEKPETPTQLSSDASSTTRTSQGVPRASSNQSNATVSINDASVIDERSFSEKEAVASSQANVPMGDHRKPKSRNETIQEYKKFSSCIKLSNMNKEIGKEENSSTQQQGSTTQQVEPQAAVTSSSVVTTQEQVSAQAAGSQVSVADTSPVHYVAVSSSSTVTSPSVQSDKIIPDFSGPPMLPPQMASGMSYTMGPRPHLTRPMMGGVPVFPHQNQQTVPTTYAVAQSQGIPPAHPTHMQHTQGVPPHNQGVTTVTQNMPQAGMPPVHVAPQEVTLVAGQEAVTVSLNEEDDDITKKSNLNPLANEFKPMKMSSAVNPQQATSSPNQSPVQQPQQQQQQIPVAVTVATALPGYYAAPPYTTPGISRYPQPRGRMMSQLVAMNRPENNVGQLTGPPLFQNPAQPPVYAAHNLMMYPNGMVVARNQPATAAAQLQPQQQQQAAALAQQAVAAGVQQQQHQQQQQTGQLSESATAYALSQHSNNYVPNQVMGNNNPTHVAPHHQATPPHSQGAGTAHMTGPAGNNGGIHGPSPSPIVGQGQILNQSNATPQQYATYPQVAPPSGGNNGGTTAPPLLPSPNTPTSPPYPMLYGHMAGSFSGGQATQQPQLPPNTGPTAASQFAAVQVTKPHHHQAAPAHTGQPQHQGHPVQAPVQPYIMYVQGQGQTPVMSQQGTGPQMALQPGQQQQALYHLGHPQLSSQHIYHQQQ